MSWSISSCLHRNLVLLFSRCYLCVQLATFQFLWEVHRVHKWSYLQKSFNWVVDSQIFHMSTGTSASLLWYFSSTLAVWKQINFNCHCSLKDHGLILVNDQILDVFDDILEVRGRLFSLSRLPMLTGSDKCNRFDGYHWSAEEEHNRQNVSSLHFTGRLLPKFAIVVVRACCNARV